MGHLLACHELELALRWSVYKASPAALSPHAPCFARRFVQMAKVRPWWFVCTGDVWIQSWLVEQNETAMQARSACQSLGAFYIAPTPIARRFLAKLIDRIMYTCETSPPDSLNQL